MDINLPGISGLEAFRALREDPSTSQIPVIALSANALPHDIEMCLDAGFFGYLTKPIKINEFMRTLDAAFEFADESGGTASETALKAVSSYIAGAADVYWTLGLGMEEIFLKRLRGMATTLTMAAVIRSPTPMNGVLVGFGRA
jgi:CheY-like chemotaxis protein